MVAGPPVCGGWARLGRAVTVHGTVPIFAAESAKMGLSPSARKGTGTFFAPKRAEKEPVSAL